MSLLSKLFHYVLLTKTKYRIDESHGLSHSMNVLNFANAIYENELPKNPTLEKYEKTIYVSAILHDMCDKKYMNQTQGLLEINNFLEDKMTNEEIAFTTNIINTMSYSTVKKNGFPDLGEYQYAYHVVREADLLTAYDFDRCMIYNMYRMGGNLQDSYDNALNLFENRVWKHNEDGLFLTNYSKEHYLDLHNMSINRCDFWKKMLKKTM